MTREEEIMEFIKDVAEWDKEYSSTHLRIRAKMLIKKYQSPDKLKLPLDVEI